MVIQPSFNVIGENVQLMFEGFFFFFKVKKMNYFGIEVSFSTIFTHDKCLGFVHLTTGLGELSDFNLMSIALRRSNVDPEWRIRNMLIIEFHTDTIFT